MRLLLFEVAFALQVISWNGSSLFLIRKSWTKTPHRMFLFCFCFLMDLATQEHHFLLLSDATKDSGHLWIYTIVNMHPVCFNESYSPRNLTPASKLIQTLKVDDLVQIQYESPTFLFMLSLLANFPFSYLQFCWAQVKGSQIIRKEIKEKCDGWMFFRSSEKAARIHCHLLSLLGSYSAEYWIQALWFF